MIKPGDIFGRLTVLEFHSYVQPNPNKQKLGLWVCKCECGSVDTYRGKNLQKAHSKSCGCLGRDILVARNTTHGFAKSPAYNSWAMMIQRCTNENFPGYEMYGAVGVTMDPAWFSFEKFHADMGDRPNGTSLDRIRVAEGYKPDNCRWADDFVQARNRRSAFVNSNFGLRGVVWRDDFKRYSTHIGVNRKQLHLGLFTDFFEACCARKSAENRLWIERDDLI